MHFNMQKKGLQLKSLICIIYFPNLIAACAAANRAIGTRYGEQET